ncbi:MAG: PAS domain S-box protein [Methylophilales bacterium]|nr:PAS domain S-box protein [Methylophilales bacterium]
MSLRFRLNLLITALLLLFMVATGAVIVKGTRSSIQEGVEAAVRVTTQLLDTVVESAFSDPESGHAYETMHHFLQSLGHVRSSDIFLYDNVGRLIYQSPPSKYRSNVNPPQWFVSLVSPKSEAVMKRVGAATLMVRSDPSGAVREAWNGLVPLMWVAAGFFILLNVIVYWALGRSLKPMGGVLQAINRMEDGDLSVRLSTFGLPEFQQIGQSFNRMAASLESSTEESRRLALVVKQTGDAIMMHGLDGNISLWNPAAEKLFGYAAADIIGKSAALLMPKGREHELKRNLVMIADRRLIENVETQRITRDGRLLEVVLSAAPLIDPHENKVIGEICTMRDVTERKRMEEAERELEENRQLTQLIQHHIEDERRSLARELHDELGQYVTAVKTFAVAIANKTKESMPEVESSAQTIVSAANHIYDGMHNIIRQLRPGALDNLGLTETLRDAVSQWQLQNPQINFSLKFSGELEGLGETININLYRIVQESVTNILRYAKANEVHIRLARTKTGKISLTVQDNGVGMDNDKVDQTRHFGLLGMRERVQALSGIFSVKSELGSGVAIKVEIPN